MPPCRRRRMSIGNKRAPTNPWMVINTINHHHKPAGGTEEARRTSCDLPPPVCPDPVKHAGYITLLLPSSRSHHLSRLVRHHRTEPHPDITSTIHLAYHNEGLNPRPPHPSLHGLGRPHRGTPVLPTRARLRRPRDDSPPRLRHLPRPR